MRNKKILYYEAILLITAVIFLVAYFTFFKCLSSTYVVACHYHDSEEIKNVSCASNKDCSVKNMKYSCSPGYPNLLKCGNAKYYCDNGYCKGCDCRDLP